MRLAKLAQTGNVQDDVRRVMHAVNFHEVIYPIPVGPPPGVIVDTNLTDVGGMSVDRSVFRKLLPDDRWFIYAAGRVDPADSDGVTISLVYTKDDQSNVTLGAATLTGAGPIKTTLGPFDVFGTAGVPKGETVPIVRLLAQKINTGVATLRDWTLWWRLLPAKQ